MYNQSRPDPDQPLRSQDLLRRAKQDQQNSIHQNQQLLSNHLDLLVHIQRDYSVTPGELVGDKVQGASQIPRRFKKKISQLQEMIRAEIIETAQRIENRNYQESETAVRQRSQIQRNRASQLIVADKQISISNRSLYLAINHFTELNKDILAKLVQSEMAKDASTASRLLLANAVLVYELCDFVIHFIEGFRMLGIEELRMMKQESATAIARSRQKYQELLREAMQPNISQEERWRTQQEAQDLEQALRRIEGEWESYWRQVEQANQIPQSYVTKLPDLRLMRKRAEARLDFLTLVELHGFINTNLRALDLMATDITTKLEMPRLTSERIQLLLGGI